MHRSKGDMASPRHLLVLFALNYITLTYGGPLGPLPNVTSADLGLKEGSCALGDVVYLPGDEFPGATPCERCSCGARGLHCTTTQCEPRPGCKALHRPDHCCPTYQCECEQEGRVYGNGEKLVDPRDPCRVCYCQGGEVVCRRIACFVRDDCTPRLVPGRCCPEYDDCPLRGVTSLPAMTTTPSASPVEVVDPSAVPSPPKEVKQEITIKEITPVSEIPIITDVKIKEILPSPSIEVAEYSSSKSPLIPREATSEKTTYTEKPRIEPEPSAIDASSTSEIAPAEEKTSDSQGIDDTPPSKISFSTQDSINSEIYPSNVPIIATMGVPAVPVSIVTPVATIKAPVVEEEDTSFLDHNPAFPPLPDDLSVLSNHGDEIVPEPSAETEHLPIEHIPTPEATVPSIPTNSEPEVKIPITTTARAEIETVPTTTEKSVEVATETTAVQSEMTTTSETPIVKENPMLNLRSAIPTEILSTPSEEIHAEEISTAGSMDSSPTGSINTDLSKGLETITDEPVQPKKLEDVTTEQAPLTSTKLYEVTSTENVQSDAPKASEEFTTDEPDMPLERVSFIPSSSESVFDTTTNKEESSTTVSTSTAQDQTTSSIAKSNVATEVTSQTELSSLPIETSDQNPHDAAENVSKDTLDTSTADPLTTLDKNTRSSAEEISVSRSNDNAVDNVETTEFIMNFGSSETATINVEIIKIPGDSDKKAAIIDNADNKNALTDLIKLVSDVASISDHTDAPVTDQSMLTTTISESEELIPVNAGYKSKNSNFNQNSITEVPFKSKSGPATNKQKIVEIEDDEAGGITDAAPPNDKVEPTTRRPIIDNVSADDVPEIKTDKKDIEIITQSYVPTINKRPTKVVLKDDHSVEPMEEEPAAAAGPVPEAAPDTTTAAPQ